MYIFIGQIGGAIATGKSGSKKIKMIFNVFLKSLLRYLEVFVYKFETGYWAPGILSGKLRPDIGLQVYYPES